MAGHSQFKNIMHRKGKQDAKRGKLFTKLIREIMAAARGGLPDPAANPRLRAAVLAARDANMPKDTVDRAIRRGSGQDGGEAYEEVRYEGYGPGRVAVIIEALTDNRNRTASEIRSIFTKSGGSLGETRVQSVMDDHPLTCTPATELDEVRRMMLGRHARYMPVVTDRTLMGVISFYDVARAVVDSQDFENRMLKAYIRDWPVESADELPSSRARRDGAA